MKEVSIAATRRDSVGKGFARRERMAGNIPAIVYGPEIQPLAVAVNEKLLRLAVKSAGGIGVIFNLLIDGDEKKVILREIQRDPVTSKVLHIDFHAISMTKPINIAIPIKFVGTPRGVKTDGGIMQITMRELDVSCLPTNIPDTIEIDVEELGIGDSVHVRDLSIANVQIVSAERRTIVVIAAPTVIKAEEVAEEAEELEGEAVEGEVAEEETAQDEDKAEDKKDGKDKKDKKDKRDKKDKKDKKE